MKYSVSLCLLVLTVSAVPYAMAETKVQPVTVSHEKDMGLAHMIVSDELSEAQLNAGQSLEDDVRIETSGITGRPLHATFIRNSAQLDLLTPSPGETPSLPSGELPQSVRVQPLCCIKLAPEESAAVTALSVAKDQAGGDGVVLTAVFQEGARQQYRFHDGMVELIGSEGLKHIEIEAKWSYAIVPTLIGDDLIYAHHRAGALDELNIPAENALLGLYENAEAMLVACWPPGNQTVALNVGVAEVITGASVTLDGKSLYLSAVVAPGLWHAEPMDAAEYEKDKALSWKPPFEAKWLTQMVFETYAGGDWANVPPYTEYDGIASTFNFGSESAQVWRETIGFHNWPCWFAQGTAYLRFGQKVSPPDKDVLIYALERSDKTPEGVQLPMDLIQKALGKEEAARIWDSEGRSRLSLYRKGCVFGEPTCGTTANLEKIFEAGQEVEKRETVLKVADDLMYYLQQMKSRVDVYGKAAGALREFCAETKAARPEMEAFLESIDVAGVANDLDTACRLPMMVNLLPSAEDIIEQLKDLSEVQSEDNLKKYKKLKGEITGRGALVDGTTSHDDFLVRGLAQRAGYRCVDDPQKTLVAKDLRALIRRYLRTPTGWEQHR